MEEKNVSVMWGKIGKLNIYEVTEGELNILEKAGKGTTRLNLSIVLITLSISIALSFLVSIPKSETINIILIVMSFSSLVLGLFLFLEHKRMVKQQNKILANIRKRIESVKVES